MFNRKWGKFIGKVTVAALLTVSVIPSIGAEAAANPIIVKANEQKTVQFKILQSTIPTNLLASFINFDATVIEVGGKQEIHFSTKKFGENLEYLKVNDQIAEEVSFDGTDIKVVKVILDDLTTIYPAEVKVNHPYFSGVYTFNITFDTTAPTLKVAAVSDKSTSVTGTTEAGASVTVTAGGKSLGNATADENGAFSINIKKQKANVKLIVTATDKSENSESVTITVADKTAPAIPKVNKVTAKTTQVKGSSEAGAIVYVYKGKTRLGKATVNKKGNFSVKIKKQKAKMKLAVYAVDKSGNKSKNRTVTVQK